MDYIKSFDFLSTNTKLYVDKNIRFKNFLGGLITIMSFLFTFIFSCISLNDLVKRNNMRLIINEEIILTPKYNLTHLPIMFLIYNQQGERINDTNRLFKVQATKININNNNFKNDLRPNIIYPSIIDVRSCSEVFSSNHTSEGDFNYLLDESTINQSNCLDLSEETIIEGKLYENRNQKFIRINLKRCSNSTNNNNNCLPNYEIDNILNKSQFVIKMADFYLDNNDIDNPGHSYLKRDIFTLNNYSLKVFNYNIKQVEYNTDAGFFFTENKSNLYFKQELLKNENYLANEEDELSILKIIISMSNNKTTFFRSYDKFQNYLASVMAVFQLIILINKCILSFFIDNYYFNYICNYINLFQKFEIDLLNRNVIKNKIKRNNINIERKSWNILNENSINKAGLINKDNYILLKENQKKVKNENDNKNIKINKLRIRSNKLNDVVLTNNPKNNRNRLKRPSIIKNIESNNNTNLNNVDNIINIHINKEKNVLNNIIIKEEKSFENQNNKLKSDNFKASNNNLNLNNMSNANLQNVNITNLALLSRNFNSGSRIFKRPTNKLKIFNFDLVKKYFCRCKTIRLKALDLGIDYIKKKLSIEELLRKILEVDKLKFLTVEKDVLESFSNIGGPDVFFSNESKVCDLDNFIYNRNLIFDNDYTEELWNRYELKENFKNTQPVNKLFRSTKNIMN